MQMISMSSLVRIQAAVYPAPCLTGRGESIYGQPLKSSASSRLIKSSDDTSSHKFSISFMLLRFLRWSSSWCFDFFLLGHREDDLSLVFLTFPFTFLAAVLSESSIDNPDSSEDNSASTTSASNILLPLRLLSIFSLSPKTATPTLEANLDNFMLARTSSSAFALFLFKRLGICYSQLYSEAPP